MTSRRRIAIVAVIVAAYVVLCVRAVGYPYVWDDVPEIARSTSLDGAFSDGIRATQAERIDPTLAHTEGVVLAYDSYRPLLFTSYWLEVQAAGKSPALMHLDNLLVGALAILLAFGVARRLVGDTAALVVTAVFALHPLHVEAVVYVSGRGDLFAGTLALAAALASVIAMADARRRRHLAWTAIAAIAFALSLAAKEAYIALPVAVAALGWSTGAWRRGLAVGGALVAAAALMMLLRSSVIATTSGFSVSEAIANIPGVAMTYLRSTILPFDLSTDRPFDATLTAPGWIAIGIAVLGLAATVVRRGWPARLPAWLAGLVWWGVLIAPSAIVIGTTGVASDRYMYVPLFGLAVALVAGAERGIAKLVSLRLPLLALAAVWGAMLAAVTWIQVATWESELALHSAAAAMVPDSGPVHWRLGSTLAMMSRWEEASVELARSVELDPTNFHALDNLGVAYLQLARYRDAQNVLERGVRETPRLLSFRPWFNLGIAQRALGDDAGACSSFRQSLTVRSTYTPAREALRSGCLTTRDSAQEP